MNKRLCYFLSHCCAVKANATACNNTPHASSTKRQSHGDRFTKVHDRRKQPIRELWQRNGRFYAQLKSEDGITSKRKTRRVPLVDKDSNAVATVAEAKTALEK